MNLAEPHQPDIALFLRGLYGGGAERVMLNLAFDFIERGLKVDLVLARAAGPYLKQVQNDVRIVDLKAQWMPSSLPKLAAYLRRVKPKTLLTALHYPCEIAICAKRLANVSTRILVSEHNTLSIEAKTIPQLSVRLSPFAARLLYPQADGIIAVSKGVAQDLANVIKVKRDRIRVIYNPVLTPQLFVQAKEPVEHPWFRSGQPPVIVGVGRLTPQKDFSTLIKAFARVQKNRPIRLMILGEGPDLDKLKTLIDELGLNESIALPGFVANPYAYMAKAAIFVLSSIYEGLGNVLIEAMALGIPVVSTNCKSGPAEILADGRYGALTPIGNDKTLAEAILNALDNPSPKVDSAWLNQFTLKTCAESYLDVLGLSETSTSYPLKPQKK